MLWEQGRVFDVPEWEDHKSFHEGGGSRIEPFHLTINFVDTVAVPQLCLTLPPHRLQPTQSSLSPRACSNSRPLSHWCHPTISSSVIPFSSCLQSFPASGFFLVTWLFASVGQIFELQLQDQSLQWISGLISFRIDWLDLLTVQVTFKSLL